MDNDIKQQLSKVDYYLRLALKKRWLIILPFCVAMIVGCFLTIKLPKIYSASNLILVIPKSVPDKYVPDVLATDVQQRINTIKQQIMSRTNLEKIIEELNLFSEPKYEQMFFIDKIKNIRKNTSIKVTKSRTGIDSFIISFKGEKPEIVMNVVNTLSDSFINESVKVIENQVIETNSFLSGELANLRRRLEEIEGEINVFRKKNMGELPEELDTNLNILVRLNEQQKATQENLRDAKNRVASIESRIAIERANIASISQSEKAAVGKGQNLPNTPSELEQLQALLQKMQNRYTDNHPDVIRLKSAIAAKVKNKNSGIQADKDVVIGPTLSMPLPKASMLGNRVLYELYAQRDAALREVKENEIRIEGLEKEIEKYQERVENTPKRDQELTMMRRNYENIQRSYNNLLDRKLESDIAVNMEKKQKGQKFRVIDSAKLPRKPISPNMKLIFIAMVGLGLGSGLGVIVLMDLLDSSIRIPDEVVKKTGIPTIALIPEVYGGRQKFRQKMNRVFSVLGGGLAIGFFLVFSLLSFYGFERIIVLINKHIKPLISF